MTDLHQAILTVLDGHRGRENRIGRVELLYWTNIKLGHVIGNTLSITGCGDREMRAAIQELRDQGHLICSSSGAGGYWLADSMNEAQEMYDDYHGRAMSCLVTAKKIMESAQREFGGQLELR